MKNQHKAMIISGLLILLVWGGYITFIYLDSIPETMDKEVRCKLYVVAATQNCHPGTSTHFGNPFGDMP